MRIIAGRFRRRKLLSNPGLTTRPITDFVKECLFERLGDWLKGQRIADIFSGTGTIGLEALSRGAASVVFIEKDSKAVELLRRNIASIGPEAEKSSLCWKADIFRCSFRPKGDVAKFVPFDCMFVDPPFVMIEELTPETELFRVLKQLARHDVSSPDGRLVLRTPQDLEFVMPAVWELEHHWPFSSMQIFMYRKASQPSSILSSEPAEAMAEDQLTESSGAALLSSEVASDVPESLEANA